MQIYMKDGKALWMNEKAITPKAIGETWVLNEQCFDFPADTHNNIIVNFISNNIKFTSISVKGGINAKLYYDNTPVAQAELSHDGHDIRNWYDEAYRTITFLEPPTGDLLTWLQANGTKQ